MEQKLKRGIVMLPVFLAVLGMQFFMGQGILAKAEEAQMQAVETAAGTEMQASNEQVQAVEEDAGGTRAEAMEIELNRTYSEVISSGSDEDYFKFTTTKRGYVQVTLEHNAADENDTGSGWDLYIQDDEGKTILSKSYIGTSWTSVALPYAVGTSFYIQIVPHGGYGAVACVYDLTVTQTAADDWESELNETQAAANAIDVDKTYHGICLSGSDKDYFKFTTTERGYFQVSLAHNAADRNSASGGWDIYVMDEDGGTITYDTYIDKSWHSIVLPYAQAGRTFYVQVVPHGGYGALYCVYDLTITQTAVSDWELDPNGKQTTATEIRMNQAYHGILVNGADEDYYKFTTTTRGYFQLSFVQNAADGNNTGGGWDVYVLNESGETLAYNTYIGKSWTSIALPYAQAGRTFYIRVVSHGGYGAVHCVYDLTVTQTAASNWEMEPNGTMAAATPISVNQTYHGITGSSGDKDLFRFQTTARGYFNIQLAHNHTYSSNESPNWEVKVLNDAGEQLIRYVNVRTSMSSIALPYAQAGRTFYIQVEPYNSSSLGAYDLSVVQTAAADWELEPNGTFAGANSIQVGKAYQGITHSSGDADYYQTAISSSGRLKIRLNPLASNAPGSVRNGWDIYVYDKKLNEVSRLRGVKTDNALSLDVKKGTYYIKIEPYSSYSAPELCRYSLSTDFVKAPSKPKMASVKPSKRAATVKWKKVSGASGYYIYRSETKTGEYIKVKTIKKGSVVSWKNKKLNSGKKYYYKVAAYKKAKGAVAVSSYSKAKAVKVK